MATKRRKKTAAPRKRKPATKRKRSAKRRNHGSTKPAGHGFKFVVERIKLDRRGYDKRGRHYAREPGMKLFQVKVIDKATDIYQDALVQARTMKAAKADVMASMMRSLSSPGGKSLARAAARGREPAPYMHADSRGLEYAPPPPRGRRIPTDVIRVPLDSDGYTRNGRYYGVGEPLWHVRSADGAIDEYVRAATKAEALQSVADTQRYH